MPNTCSGGVGTSTRSSSSEPYGARSRRPATTCSVHPMVKRRSKLQPVTRAPFILSCPTWSCRGCTGRNYIGSCSSSTPTTRRSTYRAIQMTPMCITGSLRRKSSSSKSPSLGTNSRTKSASCSTPASTLREYSLSFLLCGPLTLLGPLAAVVRSGGRCRI